MDVADPPRVVFERSRTSRVVAGVAGGIAERVGIDPTIIRLAFVVLSFAGGFGVVLYLFGWLVGSEPDAGAEPHAPGSSGPRQVVSIACVVAGIMLLLRETGLWFGDAVAWSVGLSAFGSAILWTRSDDEGRGRFARLTSRLPRTPAEVLSGDRTGRLVVGAVLVLAGMAIFLAANTSWTAIGSVAFAVTVTMLGAGLILGPWAYELVRQLGAERRERIRSEERAEVAAHLHDSVLQTLAMIQRSSSSRDMVSLARGQERELRAWLYGRGGNGSGSTLSAAIDDMASRVERRHGVAVETVVVGDAPMDDKLRALVDAAAEATTNAAKHSGARAVSVYAEVAADATNLYVRDEGRGFESGELPADRRGIVESIVGRMERNGGSAVLRTEPDEGTEVHLAMPRRPS